MLGILEPVDTDEERRQIARRPDPATAGIQPHDVSLVGIVGAVIFNLADRPPFQRVLGYLHVGDAATLQDIVIDVLRVGLPGQLFDDSAEDALAEIGVGKALSRRNSQRHILQRPCDQLAMRHLRVRTQGIVKAMRPGAGGVGQQVLDGDLLVRGAARTILHQALQGRHCRVIGAENGIGSEHIIAEPQLSLLDQRENAGRGDGLADARDPKAMLRRQHFS